MERHPTHHLPIDKLYDETPPTLAAKGEKFVIFSDLHMGDGRALDDFHRNSRLFQTVLTRYYYSRGYTLILNGDVEELHRYKLIRIQKRWKDIFDLFCRFAAEGRLHKIYGNHDSELLESRNAQSRCDTIKALKLVVEGREFFIYHGHQASHYYNTFEDLIRIALRFVAVPLRIRTYSVAYNNTKKSHVENEAYKFARKNGIVAVIGHTHRPLFESYSKLDSLKFKIEWRLREYQKAKEQDKPALIDAIGRYRREFYDRRQANDKEHSLSFLYSDDLIVPCVFNSGCVVGKRGMTSIEIADGNISLVHWYGGTTNPKYINPDPRFTSRLEGTDYTRHILKHDTLDYIFTRIRLLS